MAEEVRSMSIDLSMRDMGIERTLSQIRQSFKTLNSDVKLSNKNFQYGEKGINGYKSRIRELDSAVKLSQKNITDLSKKYHEVGKEQGYNSKEALKLRKEWAEQKKELSFLEKDLEEASQGFSKLQEEQRKMKRINESSIGRMGQQFENMGPKIKSIGDSMKSVGRSMSMYVTAPVVGGLGLAAKKSIDFDDSMRKVKATSGATGQEFKQLSDKALEMGKTTKFTASESADALNYMALAGWDSKEMMSGINGVMDLAAASGEDLGTTSDIVTDSLTAFGMKAKDSGEFADVLAQTSSKANTDVKGLGDAFKYAAPVAGALGYSVQDTSIAIGLMSNAGMDNMLEHTAMCA